MSLLRHLVTALVLLRAAHALAHLVMPFEVLDFTQEGIKGCDAKQLKNAACVFSTSSFAQGGIFEFGWAIILYNWSGSQRIRALVFASLNIFIAAVDSWSAHGADIDVSSSIEVQFSEKMALASVVLTMLIFRSPETHREAIETSPSLMYNVNDLWFLACCALKFAMSLSAAHDPIEVSMLSAVGMWNKNEKFVLARMVALSGVHSAALAISLAMLTASDRAGLQAYMLMAASQVFSYMIEASIASRMPAEMQIHNTLGGHAFLISMYSMGLFLLFITWRESGYRLQSTHRAPGAAQQNVKRD